MLWFNNKSKTEVEGPASHIYRQNQQLNVNSAWNIWSFMLMSFTVLYINMSLNINVTNLYYTSILLTGVYFYILYKQLVAVSVRTLTEADFDIQRYVDWYIFKRFAVCLNLKLYDFFIII